MDFVKILVMSDSHGNRNAMLTAVAKESPEMILHLGDNERDCTVVTNEFPEIPLRLVRGNCDLFSSAPDIDEFMLNGKLFLMTHGHLHGVKTGFSSIVDSAARRDADILLFGHTHIPYYSIREDISIVNPGSVGLGGKTYAVLELKNGVFECNIKTV